MKYTVLIILIAFIQLCFYSCKTNTDPIQPQKGYVSVLVIDDIVGPVKDVEIYISPDSLLKMTDKNGIAFFSLDVGSYFVDADVCCIGPGFIKYHESVKVVKNDTVRVELKACLLCL